VLTSLAQATFDEIQEMANPELELDIGLYLALFAIGMLIGFVGNIYKSRFLVAVAIAVIFAAVFLAQLIAFLRG
jgi:hypothetical protein